MKTLSRIRALAWWVAVVAIAWPGAQAQASPQLLNGGLTVLAELNHSQRQGLTTGVPGGFGVVNCAPLQPCDPNWSLLLRGRAESRLTSVGEVAAEQDHGGYYEHNHNLTLTNYDGNTYHVSGFAHTSHRITVTTVVPDTPLVLDLMWLGGMISAGSYYGSGEQRASMSVQLQAQRNGNALQPVWGFTDEIVHDSQSGAALFNSSSTVVDVLRAGLPRRSFEAEWRDMMVWGEVQRAPLFATLDFGLLQPGETFGLRYDVTTATLLDSVPYAARGLIDLKDPFGLRQGVSGFVLRGLALTDDGGPPATVPEPGTLGLAMLVLGAALRRRHARPAAAAL